MNDSGVCALELAGLGIALPDGRVLLRDGCLRVDRGEFVLLAGASGSGKSTLLRRIAGIGLEDARIRFDGTILVEGKARTDAADGRVGIVFQNHALLDEFSPEQNVQFAIDHRPATAPTEPGEARELLNRLGVPFDACIGDLSGGERQRLAVARTLAMDPPLLLFDEPTTGLDPLRSRAVAELIGHTHQTFGKTVIVVTHDYAPFLSLSPRPRIILLDAKQASLREVDVKELLRVLGTTKPSASVAHPVLPAADAGKLPGTAVAGLIRRTFRARAAAWVEEPGEALLTLLGGLIAPATGWAQPRWKLRFLWHYARKVAIGATAIYVAVAGLMLGFVTVYFGLRQMPYRQITIPLLSEEFLAAIGYSSFRVLTPLLVCVLLASKCGAAIAADLGARRLTHQLEAMRSLRARPHAYLYGSIVPAMVAGTPLLAGLAYVTTCYAALVAYLLIGENATVNIFQRNFFAHVWRAPGVWPEGLGWLLLKLALSGLVIASIAYHTGIRPKSSSMDVSRDVSLTIFWASLAVLMVHSVMAFVEF